MQKVLTAFIIFVILIHFSACTPSSTESPIDFNQVDVESTITATLPQEISGDEITTPLPVVQPTALPPTPIPGLPPLPESGANNICPNTQPSLLMPGKQGRVSNQTPDPNRVRAEPGKNGALLGEIPAGAYFDVLEGPNCVEDGAWFKVKYENLEGWMKEGSSEEYWVMPIYTDAQIITGPQIELPGITIMIPEEISKRVEIQQLPFDPEKKTPPVTRLRLMDYPYYDFNPSVFVYSVTDYLYYRPDLHSQLEGIRTAINKKLRDETSVTSLPEFRDVFIKDKIGLFQAGRFGSGYGLFAIAVDNDKQNPNYVFFGFSADMQYLYYIKLPVRLTFGQLAQATMNDFSPSIKTLNAMTKFTQLSDTIQVLNPAQSGKCPGAPPFTLQLGDWARVSVDPPIPSRIRSTPGSSGEVVGNAQPGENLLVIDGPQCANGYTWWKVRSLAGMEGWTIEGDTSSYWLIEPISTWYPLPEAIGAYTLKKNTLREINFSTNSILVPIIYSEFLPQATPMPTPATMETPWPDDPRYNIYTTAAYSEHSRYRFEGFFEYAGMTIFNLQDPLNRYYLNNQSFDDCTRKLKENLKNDPPISSYINAFCGIGGGIPLHFVADVKAIQFNGGKGLRFLIASANYLTINKLDYIFQGLSDDGRYYIVAMFQDIEHPYIVDDQLWETDFGPLLAWKDGQYEAAKASYKVFNERIETLLDARVVTLYPDLLLLDEMMASIEIK